MAGEKTKPSIDFKLARKFIKSLAKELVSDSERGFFLASNSQDLEDALQKSADSLPAGKLRSTLLPILQQQSQKEAFVSALQNELRALSAKLELHGDVLLTPPASDRLFEALVTYARGKGTSPFTNTKSKDVFSHEDKQLLLSRDPAPHILWVLAAMELSITDGSNGAMNSSADGGHGAIAIDVNSLASSISSSASALLHCLKPWIVGRNASIAVATLAPLVPLVFESLKQSNNKIVSNIKELRTLVKEVLSFIVAVNYKEEFMQGSLENSPRETLLFPVLFDGFRTVYEALRIDSIVTQMEGQFTTQKLKLMFPLASELTKKALKPPDARIGVLADIVKVEFVLLHMVLEVIYCTQKKRVGERLVTRHVDIGREQVGSTAVSGVAAFQHDLLLDVLLSDLVVGDLLDDGEWSLVRSSIFKALLMGGHVFSKNFVDETSAKNRKALEIFLKRIAVARKISASQRAPCDILDNLGGYLKAPHKLLDYVKSFKITRKLPEQGLRNDQALIGWLLRLDDAEFQAVVEGTSCNDSQADEKVDFKTDDLCTVRSSADCGSLRDACKQDDPEALFFVDTMGEEKGQGDDNTPNALRKSKKSRKRKERQVIFHRQGQLTKKKEECVSEGLSDSSLDSMIDDQIVVRVKRANQESEGSAH